jgi:hypothetical protein
MAYLGMKILKNHQSGQRLMEKQDRRDGHRGCSGENTREMLHFGRIRLRKSSGSRPISSPAQETNEPIVRLAHSWKYSTGNGSGAMNETMDKLAFDCRTMLD